MSMKRALIAELQMEAASSRKMLERVPTEKNDWQPHEKSMKLGRLSTHVAELPGWVAFTLKADELDFLKMEFKPLTNPTAEELLELHDTNVKHAIEALENATDEDFEKMWTLRRGEHIIFTMPKKVVIRSMAYNHLVHHRGQLSVYLRLLDVPVPGMYGPSHDERPAAVPVADEALGN